MAGYIGSQTPVVSNGSQRKYTFTATAAQTVFTGMDIPNPQQIQVFQNGVRLVITTDYTVSSGTTVTLVNAASAGDSLVVILFADYQLLDTDALTFTGGTTIEGGLTVDNDGATVLTVDRATSDGSIVDFKKDGSTVGSIGVSASDDFYIGASTASHAGVYFGTDIVYPMRANSLSDGVTSIGHSSNRFNNLYLSGGVYLGGTGAANKLDDYEEGTFTYTLNCSTSGSYTPRTGYATGFYTKVGRIVTINLRYESQGSSSPSGNVQLGNLPFVFISSITSGSPSFGAPILLRGANNNGDFSSAFLGFQPGGTYATFYKQLENGTFAAITNNDIASAIEGYACFTYVTSA